eukprot:5170733-Prymnesium_polylepis.1
MIDLAHSIFASCPALHHLCTASTRVSSLLCIAASVGRMQSQKVAQTSALGKSVVRFEAFRGPYQWWAFMKPRPMN